MYHIKIDEIVADLHAATALMTRHGINVEGRAKAAGTAEQTMKQYASSPRSRGFRQIPAATL